MDYKIYEDNGHLGIMAEDGTRLTPPVYDEIRTCHGRHYRCRVFENWDHFYTGTGEIRGLFRGEFPKSEWEKAGATTSRAAYDEIKEFESRGITIVYENGRFGYKDEQGKLVLRAQFDSLKRWRHGNVIETRRGDDFRYFDLDGNEILTVRTLAKGLPFWEASDALPLSHSRRVAFRKLVETAADNRTYESEAGPVRFQSFSRAEFSEMIKDAAEVLPVDEAVMELFNDRYSFKRDANAFCATIQRPTCAADWNEAVARFEKMGADLCCVHVLDLFISNENTPLRVENLHQLRRIYDTKYTVYRPSCMALGRDRSLPNGAVRWIHLEFSNDAPYEEDWLDDVLHDVKQSWEEKLQILERNCTADDDFWRLFCNAVICIDAFYNSEPMHPAVVDFCVGSMKWALGKTKFPNALLGGMIGKSRTLYDWLVDLLDVGIENHHHHQIHSLAEITQEIRKGGALTTEELFAMEKEYYANCDQYDYSFINNWKDF